MIHIKMDAKYVEDLDAEVEVVEWPAKPAAVEPIVHVQAEPSVDPCAAAKAALLTYNYNDLKTRVGEVKMACRAAPMEDDAYQTVKDDPMF